MPRRIEIELTSAQTDGTWTWRAAGARQPRGVLDGALLYEGAKAGDVLRAEAEFEIDGIVIVAVLPPKEKKRSEPERIEIIGPSRPAAPGVTTQLVGRADRRPSDRRRRDDGRPPRDRDRTERDSGRPARPRREGGPDARDGRRAGGRGESRSPDRRPPASDEQPTGDREGSRPERRRPDGGGPSRRGPDRTGERGDRSDRGDRRPARAERDPGKSRRLNPANVHRQAVLASLPPEQQPIAEQVLRGGIPAVRTAVHLEREKAAAEGRPAPNAEALIALAEQMLPRLKAAEWRDRAEAAAKATDDITLRDLRSVVAGADLARDDETRALATTLREALERRLARLQSEWLKEITHHLDEGRVVRALRLASRPPEPSARLEADLATRLAEAASQAMAPETPPERWAALLDAVAASPVRRTVKPIGLPSEPGAELRRAAHQQSGRIPALAAMLGVSIPPPPGPVRPVTGEGRRRPDRVRPGRPQTPARPAAVPSPTEGAAPAPEPGAPADQPTTEDAAPAEDTARTEQPTAAEQPAPAPAEAGRPADAAPAADPADPGQEEQPAADEAAPAATSDDTSDSPSDLSV